MAKKKRVRAPKVSEPTGPSPNVTYTLRTVPRPIWNRFKEQLGTDGHSVNWAFNKFIEKYADEGKKVLQA